MRKSRDDRTKAAGKVTVRKSRDELKTEAQEFDARLKRALEAGHTVHCLDEDQIGVGFRTLPLEKKVRLSLPTRWGVVVGLDMREWTKRSVSGQMLVASIMNARINQAYKLLESAGFMTKNEPLFNVPTGDGALIVFDAGEDVSKEERGIWAEIQKSEQEGPDQPNSTEPTAEERVESAHSQRLDAIGKAISFVLVLNTLFAQENVRSPFIPMEPDGAGPLPILPIYPRFCLVLDKMLLCMDVRGELNAIGPAMYTCGRILSTDHGNHFLVHDKLLHECDRHGGFAHVVRHAGLGDWKPRFHLAELPEQKVKSGQFRFADIFGHYSDEPMLRLYRTKHLPPVEYHIGTHDVLRLDSGG